MTTARSVAAIGSGIEDFSPEGYAALLNLASGLDYRFVTFDEADAYAQADGRHCLLRHDVDASMNRALAMAELEAGMGVKSTYFFMLRSAAYNLMAREAATVLRQIAALGHEIGLHFDGGHPFVTDEGLVGQVRDETDLLAGLADSEVHAVSFHQPSQAVLERDILIPGLINSYNRTQLESWHYISDSNRHWRHQDAAEMFSSGVHDKVQLLTHPMWWMGCESDCEAGWDATLAENMNQMLDFFHDNEAAFGPRRYVVIKREQPA